MSSLRSILKMPRNFKENFLGEKKEKYNVQMQELMHKFEEMRKN